MPRILIADDNEDMARSLAMLLQACGHEVSVVQDGLEAVRAVERERPDVVLLDLGMPGLDGHAVCRHIRRLPQGKRLRIFAVTGWGRARDRHRSAEAGFDGHLVKPVDSAFLLKLLTGA